MRNMMLLSFAIYIASLVPLSHLFGNTGVWIALHVFLVVRGLSLLAVLPARKRVIFGN
jgi:Na+-driven multidrug efflux pump